MNQYASDNLHIYGIDGNFDDCQNIVKQLFMEDTSEGILLTSANSINIGRLIPQVVYYVSAYVDALQAGKLQIDQEYKIVVPTGNFGNIYAGYLARQLGLPIKQLIIASNHNDVLDHFFKTGQYTIDRNLKKSISPSMDIVISSNLERYLYALLNQDVSKIKKLMETLQNQKTITVPEILNQKEFISGMASEQDTKNTIRNSLHKDSYLLDPHTAVAKSVYDQMQDPSIFTFIVSTASPYKFVDAMNESLNLESKDTLEENMKSLASYSNTTIDPRILDLLHSTPSKQVLKKDQAIPFLKQKIGDINDL
jgi:threonine synthase